MKKKLCLITFLIFFSSTLPSQALEITEVFPNPKGKDQGVEYIEIFNNTNQSISLKGYKIGNSKKYKLPETTMPPYSYFSTTSVPVKNSKNFIELISPTKKIVDTISYDNVIEDLSYSKSKNGWQWTTPTKNKKNIETKKIISENFQIISPNQIKIDQTTLTFSPPLTSALLNTIFSNSTEISATFTDSHELLEIKQESKKPIPSKTTSKDLSQLCYPIPFLLILLIHFKSAPSCSSRYKGSEQIEHESSHL